jgi:hypothetical protein
MIVQRTFGYHSLNWMAREKHRHRHEQYHGAGMIPWTLRLRAFVGIACMALGVLIYLYLFLVI